MAPKHKIYKRFDANNSYYLFTRLHKRIPLHKLFSKLLEQKNYSTEKNISSRPRFENSKITIN